MNHKTAGAIVSAASAPSVAKGIPQAIAMLNRIAAVTSTAIQALE